MLEVTVYDEDRDRSADFLGKVAIPLLSVSLVHLTHRTEFFPLKGENEKKKKNQNPKQNRRGKKKKRFAAQCLSFLNQGL